MKKPKPTFSESKKYSGDIKNNRSVRRYHPQMQAVGGEGENGEMKGIFKKHFPN